MKALSWILQCVVAIVLLSYIGSGCYHSCKYHGEADGGAPYYTLYRGAEQFWHKYEDVDYRLSIDDLIEIQKMNRTDLGKYLEKKNFSETQHETLEDGTDWRYWKYNNLIDGDNVISSGVEYYNMKDTSFIVYSTFDEKQYVGNLVRLKSGEFKDEGQHGDSDKITSFYSSDKEGVAILINNRIQQQTGLTSHSFSVINLPSFRAMRSRIDSEIERDGKLK